MNWLDICALEEINALGSRIIAGPKGDIAIFRTSDDEVFARPPTGAARCPKAIYGKRDCPRWLANRPGKW
jgi:nitrite reductase (NADH) small subunit